MSSSTPFDARRPNKIHRYKPKDTNAPGDDPTPDYMNLLGMIFSMCGLMMKAFHISGCDVISPEPPANDSTLAVILIPPDPATRHHPGANISNPGIINIPVQSTPHFKRLFQTGLLSCENITTKLVFTKKLTLKP
ncbi:ASTER-like protein [Mya arenaria]|uniref:ASTER-like protein n=1 Tax=Mya arenaria TaxID=6604 RepID=A0ABY7FQS9_MYAAR|nr:ASTER-like protein [Mya arenaria]